MKEFKFKGKRIDNGKWVHGIPFLFDGSKYYIINNIREPKGDEVEYFEVKNGKEIYKGDIVKHFGNKGRYFEGYSWTGRYTEGYSWTLNLLSEE